VAITRLDATTVRVRPRDGYLVPRGEGLGAASAPPAFSVGHFLRDFDHLVRSSGRPLRKGDVVELAAATVEVTALTPDGRPAEATFRFRVPLEDPSLRWFQFTKKGCVAFAPPAVGATVQVESPLE